MSSPELSQEAIGGTAVDANHDQNRVFAEDDEVDDAGGLFGSDEEDEGLE